MSELFRVDVVHDKHFTTIGNHAARNPLLSRAAKGLLYELCSHARAWELRHDALLQSSTDGRGRLQRSVDELKAGGYLRIDQIREAGGFSGSRWVVTSDPERFPLPDLRNRDAAVSSKTGVREPGGRETGVYKKNNLKKNEEKEERTLSLELEGTAFPPAAKQVFEYWATARHAALGRNGTGPAQKFTDARRKKIEGRLGEGYSVDDLKRAVDKVLASEFHRSGGYTDIELICRDQKHVEQYLGMKNEDEERLRGILGYDP